MGARAACCTAAAAAAAATAAPPMVAVPVGASAAAAAAYSTTAAPAAAAAAVPAAALPRNTHREFVGLAELKARNAAQVAEFEGWAAAGAWHKFHSAHYDWWAFPIAEPSKFAYKYSVEAGDVAELLADPAFVAAHRRGMALLAQSWGWDLAAGAPLAGAGAHQTWQNWPIRLWKATASAQLFGYAAEFASLRTYGRGLIAAGHKFYYGRDLRPLFMS